MFIPKNSKGELIYQYDVNSLYPYSMKTFTYPTALFAHLFGDINQMPEYSDLANKHLSFLKVKVIAPNNITHPILPVKIDNKTIYGTLNFVEVLE